MSEWISVKDRLPGFNVNVFAIAKELIGIQVFALCEVDFHEDGSPTFAWCNCHGAISGDAEFDDNYNITHWQPLPPPPTETEGETTYHNAQQQ